jgi:hypothetical protein
MKIVTVTQAHIVTCPLLGCTLYPHRGTQQPTDPSLSACSELPAIVPCDALDRFSKTRRPIP